MALRLQVVVVVLALFSFASSVRMERKRNKHTLASDCWKSRPVSKSFLQLSQNATQRQAPGFGMDLKKIEPFVTVSKDGFFEVNCIKDDMVTLADKHGDGKFEFANQNARVSIVWYDQVVPKEDRAAMTPTVCFNFCRTVPDAGFFGLAYGRQCYCTPYWKRGAGDSSQCDAVCEGDKSTMCGGMTKQSVYAMHLCADTANDLAKAKEAAEKELAVCEEAGSDAALELATKMEEVGNDLKDRAGSEGDSISSAYGQMAVVYSGDVERGHEAAAGLKEELQGKVDALAEFDGADFTDAKTIGDAEEAIADVKKMTEEADEVCGKTAQIVEDARPVRADAANHVDGDGLEEPEDPKEIRKQYVPVTYYVEGDEDTEAQAGLHRAVPSACKGKVINNPIIGQNINQCAVACDAMTTAGDNKCIGFQSYKKEDGKGMCALLSYIDEISYYTEGLCSEGGAAAASFMQKSTGTTSGLLRPERSGSDAGVRCIVKMHDMKGLTHRINSKKAGVDHINVNVHKRCF